MNGKSTILPRHCFSYAENVIVKPFQVLKAPRVVSIRVPADASGNLVQSPRLSSPRLSSAGCSPPAREIGATSDQRPPASWTRGHWGWVDWVDWVGWVGWVGGVAGGGGNTLSKNRAPASVIQLLLLNAHNWQVWWGNLQVHQPTGEIKVHCAMQRKASK